MSVRLWWKFSPNLMTPVPMIATFPPSPIAASLAPPSLPEPGATSNPARRAGHQHPDSREHAQEDGRRHPEEQQVCPEADHPAEQPSQDDRDGVVHDVAGHRRHRAPAPLGDPAEVEAEEEGQQRHRRAEAAREERRERAQDALGLLPWRQRDQGDLGEQRGAERAREGDRVADEGDRHRTHRAARNPRVSARASARRWSIMTDATARSPLTPRLAKAQPHARGPASTPPRRSMIAPKTRGAIAPAP